MAENYGITEESMTASNLLAGSHGVILYPVTLGSGAGSLKTGQVLGRRSADNKYYKFSATATDGTQTPRAILARDTDAASADAVSVAYVHGEFSTDALDWGSATSAQIEEAKRVFMQAGIYVKKIGG